MSLSHNISYSNPVCKLVVRDHRPQWALLHIPEYLPNLLGKETNSLSKIFQRYTRPTIHMASSMSFSTLNWVFISDATVPEERGLFIGMTSKV